VAALEQRLRSMERQLEKTLAARNQRIERLFGLATGLPILLAFVGPLPGLFMIRTDPSAWAAVGGLVVLSALLVMWAEVWRPPKLPSLQYLQAGHHVVLRGRRVQGSWGS